MKIFLFTLTAWLVVASGNAQATHSPVWNTGEVYLSDGALLKGELSYNWQAEVVLLRQNKLVKAFSARNVTGFKFFDDAQNTLRTFITVTYPFRKHRRQSVIVEQLNNGLLTVYRVVWPKHLFLNMSHLINNKDVNLVKDESDFDYFVADGTRITPLRDFNRKLWPRMTQLCGSTLQQYAKERGLTLDSTTDRLILINKFNYLTVATTLEQDDVSSLGR